ncbi:MAG: ATP-binding protein [Planctomycetes bacterium]|nr:ATP-binding protein [Planctomycetota bacterium]
MVEPAGAGTGGREPRDAGGGIRELLLVLALVLPGAGVVAWLTSRFSEQHTREALASQGALLKAAAEGNASRISAWFRERLADAAFYNESDRILEEVPGMRSGAAAEGSAGEAVRVLFDRMVDRHGYRSIRLVEPSDGRVLLHRGRAGQPETPPDPALLRRAVEEGTVGGDILPRQDGGRCLDFAASVGSPDPLVVVLRTDPDATLVPQLIGGGSFGPTGEILLVGLQGGEVVFHSPTAGPAGMAAGLRRPLSGAGTIAAEGLRGKSGVVEGLDHAGVPVVAAVAPVEGTPWVVMAKLDRAAVEEGLSLYRRSAWSLAGCSVLLFGGGAWISLWRARVRSRLKEAEERLRRQEMEEGLASLIRDGNDVMFLAAEDLSLLDFNDRAMEFYGYSRNEMALLNARDLRALSTRDRIEEGVAGLREGEGRIYETLHRRKDGTDVPVEVSLRTLRWGGRKVYQTAVRDITRRREAEAALESTRTQFLQAQKMEAVGRLAGGVAHDFNNMLTVINGYAEILTAGLAPSDPSLPHVKEILKAGRRAADLTRQLLAFSRHHVVLPRVLDLNALVRDLEKMLRRLIGEDIRLEVALHPGLAPVLADPGHLEQVIMNLVVNARDAIPGVGTITIRTREAPAAAGAGGGGILLEIEDTGVGMTEEVKAHVFEPFFTTKQEGKGTGLGMATVYGIVNQAGGTVGIESAPGRGTTIRVLLPRASASPRPESADGAAASPECGPRGTETVLLAEDEDQVRALAAASLRAAGYRVLEAPGPLQALDLAAGEGGGDIAMLVTDVVMPAMDGWTLARTLRLDRPGMRVLYISGYTGDHLPGKGIPEGEEFLQKPFLPKDLRRRVREILDGPRATSSPS